MNDFDPDLNYIDQNFTELNSQKSEYLSFSQFKSVCNKNDYFTFLAYNIRSFQANSDSFFCNLHGSYPEFLIFSETWFNLDNTSEILDYNSYHTVRQEKRSGGVSIYIKNYFPSFKVDHLCFANVDIEVCSVQFMMNGVEWFILGIYRPHEGTIPEFELNLLNILNDCNLHGKNVILMGDFNINLLSDSYLTENFLNSIQSLGFIPVISIPTRFDSQFNSASLIDHIWINKPTSYFSGVISCDLTDHFPTFIQLPDSIKIKHRIEPIKIEFRPINEAGMNEFQEKLSEFSGDQIYNADVNIYLEKFISHINTIYCQCFPKKVKFISPKNLLNPWITPQLSNLLDLKSKYFQLYRMKLVTKRENNLFKNKVKTIVDKSKRNYFNNLLRESRGKIAKTWNIITKCDLSH